ncbi:MAG: 16S rRNA (adenine(1518)-N(6)/adenine(1519)-N(6))-dimethyltransferase RsmA [bacterium]
MSKRNHQIVPLRAIDKPMAAGFPTGSLTAQGAGASLGVCRQASGLNLTSPAQVREWCVLHDFHPNRTLGQNFLIDRNILEAIVDAAGVRPGQRILEIGPGLGVVTAELLCRGARVTAIEKDHRLAARLAEVFGSEPGLQLIAADALEVDLDALLAEPFDALVSNLPYSVGTRILLEIAMHVPAPPVLTVTVQLEVAERFAAGPGEEARGQTGVWLQRLYDVELVRGIKPTCFWPKPEVSSALVRLTRHDRHALSPEESARYLALTKYAFMHRRKQLAASLRNAPDGLQLETAVAQELLVACGADPRVRAEDLDVTQWCALVRAWTA